MGLSGYEASRLWQQDSIAACSSKGPASAARLASTPDRLLELKVPQASADRQACGRAPVMCRADYSPTSAGHKTLAGVMPKEGTVP